jgi:hypothetical protein
MSISRKIISLDKDISCPYNEFKAKRNGINLSRIKNRKLRIHKEENYACNNIHGERNPH